MEYSGESLMILAILKEYLENSPLMTDEDFKPRNGLHIYSKRSPIDVDMISLNMLGLHPIFTGDVVNALIC
ncbi:hypothetical protein HDF18_08750 [Mucilaginibacter sp. X5P1]|uniref:hypothetical protein n=1 Tax=Mucilaginibacter sp. X5P1 TaxID=2723088 RepID=UPI00160ABA08|nr:hypothetical protein [Mucilaginibacter sp. X5P1]MBB6137748.1 hypothetical protein [Mucilaginibacter sp. X5P1]